MPNNLESKSKRFNIILSGAITKELENIKKSYEAPTSTQLISDAIAYFSKALGEQRKDVPDTYQFHYKNNFNDSKS